MSGRGKRLMVMAGGAGGHAFPGLTVAHHLMAQGWQVHQLRTADHMEADLVPKHGVEIDFVRISGLYERGIKTLIAAPLCVFNVQRQARTTIKTYKPDVVFGMDGYVSGPGSPAAWSLGIPIVLHEQNSIAGLANKQLAKTATKVTQALPGAFLNAEVAGNPMRTGALVLPLPQQRLAGREGLVRVLVVSGSQGVRIFNQTMSQVVARLSDLVTIWHQSGKGSQQSVEQTYAEAGQPQYRVTEFIDDVAAVYVWVDVVICRSGALTVSEIIATGLPTLFAPSQHKDRQQYWNTLLLKKTDAAKVIEQSQFSVDTAVNTLAGWSREALLTMAERARVAFIPNAAERVTNEMSRAARVQLQQCLSHRMNLRS